MKIKDIANESRKTTPVVLFDDVRFGYDEHAVLDHVSFHVEEGEQVTLSGRTGAGKSTLFSFTQSCVKAGLKPSAQVLKKEVIEGKNYHRKNLQLEADDKIVHIERLRFADNDPVSLEHMYLSYKKYGFLLWEDLNKSIYSIIKERMNVDLTGENSRNRNILSVEKAGSRMAKNFGTAPSEPVFVMETLIYAEDEPVYVGKDYCLGSRFCYEVIPTNHRVDI